VDDQVDVDTDYDGYCGADGSKSAVSLLLYVGLAAIGKVVVDYRGYVRFPNALLPLGTVTQVQLRLGVNIAGGANHLTDVHAYDTNGQTDPELDPGATAYVRCASGNLYANDLVELRAAGLYWIPLGGTVCADLMAARDAGRPFSLGLEEEGGNDSAAFICALEYGSNWAVLRITYTPPVQIVASILSSYQVPAPTPTLAQILAQIVSSYELEVPKPPPPPKPGPYYPPTGVPRSTRYDQALDPDAIRRALRRQKASMVEQQATYFSQIGLVEDKAKRIVEAAGISTQFTAYYLVFARSCWKASREFSGPTLEAEILALFNLWASRGLVPQVLARIAELCGVQVPGY